MKRETGKAFSFLVFVVLFLVSIVAFSAWANNKANGTPKQETQDSAAQSSNAPKLTDAQREKLRTLQVELQSVYLLEYQERDRYQAAERQYDAQAQKIAASLEAAVKDASNGVDSTKYVFNRGTLEFDPVKTPAPPK